MDQDDLAIYATEQFSKAEEFKSLSQTKEEAVQRVKDEEKRIEKERLEAIQKKKDDEEKAKKLLKLKIELKKQRDKNVQKPVPIDIPDVEIDLAELKDYSKAVAQTAARNEPDEAIVFPDSTPAPKLESDLDIADVDISGIDLSNMFAPQGPLDKPAADLVLVQLDEEEGGLANVEIDDGVDDAEESPGRLQSTAEVQTDSDMQISDQAAVDSISENAMAEVIADAEPEKAMSSPELDNFLEASEEEAEIKIETPAETENDQQDSSNDQQANMRAFGEKLGIEIPPEILALTDNAEISAGLVETAISAGKSEDEISKAMG